MKIALRAGAIAVMAAGALTAFGGSASAGIPYGYTCGKISFSSDGHSASVTCTDGPALVYALRATACNLSNCATFTGRKTGWGNKATLNVGAGYIEQSTATIVGYYS